jgi:hypothetical protein
VGLSPGGLARHLINMALFAAGQEPLLPPPHPPALESSAQWAQASGANDTLGDIARQMADQNEELQETLETRQEAVCAGLVDAAARVSLRLAFGFDILVWVVFGQTEQGREFRRSGTQAVLVCNELSIICMH